MSRLFAAALFAGVASSVAAQEAPSKLSLPLMAADGKPVGLVEMTDTPNGVLIDVTFTAGGLPAGEHGMHIHETGDCSDMQAGFEKAGEHYNPGGAEHGFVPEAGPHAGDLPNVVIVGDKDTKASVFDPALRFSEGDAPLFDDDGSALVVHAQADDYASQPSGESGDRIACTELTGK